MLTDVVCGVIAAEYFYFLVLEMFFWTHPVGRRAFDTTPEHAEIMKVLAANQGLYNGFLGAGLVFTFFLVDPRPVRLFFLGCALAAGLYGTGSAAASGRRGTARKILFAQAVPALVALTVVVLNLGS